MSDENMQFAKSIAELVVKQLSETPPLPRTWLSHREASEYLRMSPRGLEGLLASGKGPKVHRRAGGNRLYKLSDLDSYVEGGAS